MKVESTFKIAGIIKKQQEDLTHMVTKFDGSTDGFDTLVVKKGMNDKSWNNQLIVPLVDGETVFVHPDQANVQDGYVRVIHGQVKAIAVFSRSHFE